jgi:hypothetical protein
VSDLQTPITREGIAATEAAIRSHARRTPVVLADANEFGLTPGKLFFGLDQMTLLIKVAEGHTRRRPGPWNCPRPARGAPKNRKAQLAEPDDTL